MDTEVADDNTLWTICLLFGMTAFSYYQRTIVGLEARKWSSTLAGMVITLLSMGIYNSWYHFLVIISSILLMKWAGKRKCHIVTMLYVLPCMLIFRLVEFKTKRYGRSDCILHIMIFIKLIGVAYDIHITNRDREKKEAKDDCETSKHAAEDPIDPSFMDLFHYMFSYTAIMIGPHLRYRTWNDYLTLPFANSCDSQALVMDRAFHALLSGVVYTILGYFHSIEYVLTAEFCQRHYLYKNFFNLIHFGRFKLSLTFALLVVQCNAAIVGLGAYPVSLKSESGNGPTKDYSHLKNISQEEADKLEYDFETINTQTLYRIYWTPWHSDYWKCWNKTFQYFMGRYIYKDLLKDWSANNRTLLTMLFSAYWHGIELGYFTCQVLCGVYIVAEKPYLEIYKYTSGWGSTAFLVAMWMIQAHISNHMLMTFLILDPVNIYIHAAAMNFVPYFSLVIFYLFGKIALSYLQNNCSLRLADKSKKKSI